MSGEILKALKKMYPDMNIAIRCNNTSGTYQEQYDSLFWNDDFCAQYPDLAQNPSQKPLLQQILDTGYLDANLSLARCKEAKKEMIKGKRKYISAYGVKYATADDILKTGSQKFIYPSCDNSISRVTCVLNNGSSDRNWKDIYGNFHLFTHNELQGLLNVMIELIEKSFNNEKALNESVNNCLSEFEVNDININNGWETVPYEIV